MMIINKKAGYDYVIYPERIEAGISLNGAEAKSIRQKRVDLSRSVVKIVGNEAFLINADIFVPEKSNYQATRSRKLLLHKSEILSLLVKAKQQKLHFVPTKLYTSGHLIKLEVALGKPKRKFEKKQAVKKKDLEREFQEALKSEVRDPGF